MNLSPKLIFAKLCTSIWFQFFIVSILMTWMEPSPTLTVLAYFGFSDYSGVSNMNLFGVLVFFFTSLFGLRLFVFAPVLVLLEGLTFRKIEAKQAIIRARLHEHGLTLVNPGSTGWTCIKDPQGAISSIQLTAILPSIMSVNKKESAAACANFANLCEDVKSGKLKPIVGYDGKMRCITYHK